MRTGAMAAAVLATAAVAAHGQGAGKGGGGAVAVFKGRRAVSAYTQTIDAPPDRVFPLLCPIRESEWADGWVSRVVYAESGVAEPDGVYATEHEGDKDDTIWVVTRRDVVAHEIDLVYFVPGARVAKLTMAVKPLDGEKSRVDIRYTNTGLSEAGNAEIAKAFDDRAAFERRMVEWQAAMNHYLTTGRLLRHGR